MTVPGAVLVHGLWHGAWCWDAVRAALAERGVDSVAVELPLTDLPADTRAALDALDRFGRPAVLVGHSYGGAVVTGAGTHPLVRELVHVAAFQLDEGESVSRTRFGDLPDTRLGEAMAVSGDEVHLDPVLGPRLLYGDAAPDMATAATRLRPVSRLVFRLAVGALDLRRLRGGRRSCTRATADHGLPIDPHRGVAVRAQPGGHPPGSGRRPGRRPGRRGQDVAP